MVETILNDRDHDRKLVKVSSKEDFIDIYDDGKVGGIAGEFEFEDCFDWDGTLPAYFEIEHGDNAEQVSDPKKWANDIADYYEEISKGYRAFADSLN